MAAETESGVELWICNPSPDLRELRLPDGFAEAAVLDASSFVAASRQPDLFDRLKPVEAQTLSLDAYAVARAVKRN
jgi:hypothetical protein